MKPGNQPIWHGANSCRFNLKDEDVFFCEMSFFIEEAFLIIRVHNKAVHRTYSI